MGRKTSANIEAEKRELAREHTAQFGKELGTMPGSEEERRQQALAKLRLRQQAKRDGKRVAVENTAVDEPPAQAPAKRARAPAVTTLAPSLIQPPTTALGDAPAKPMKTRAPPKTVKATSKTAKAPAQPVVEDDDKSSEDSVGSEDSAGSEENIVFRRAKVQKGKLIIFERDRTKQPTEAQLLELLRDGIAWPPTRFADIKMMDELAIDEDIKELLGHMNLSSLFSMAHPTYPNVSSQFLSSLEATFHSSKHVRQGWGKIKFTVHGRTHFINFKDIGKILGLQDLEDSSLPRLAGVTSKEDIPHKVWMLLTGLEHATNRDKNNSIRHPSLRYIHRMIAHAFFPRKEVGTVQEDELRLLHQAILHYASPPDVPHIQPGFYKTFGMVGFFVKRLMHYKRWAWINHDSEPQIGIGGLITPLLEHVGINLGTDAVGPSFMDGNYLRSAHYSNGRHNGAFVYAYNYPTKEAELILPSWLLTNLRQPGAISFVIDSARLLGSHGPLERMVVPVAKRGTDKCGVLQEDHTSKNDALLFGQPRYQFDLRSGVIADGPTRQAHEYIGKLQRWNKAQDRTIFKLKNKCSELRKTVKRQAEASAEFMKKVVDVLANGAVAGCKPEDFNLDSILAPLPPSRQNPLAPRLARTEEELLRQKRNPPIFPSTSGNKSPSLSSADEYTDSDGEATASSHAP